MSLTFTQNADDGDWAFSPTKDPEIILGKVTDLGYGKWLCRMNDQLPGAPVGITLDFEADSVEAMQAYIRERFIVAHVDADGKPKAPEEHTSHLIMADDDDPDGGPSESQQNAARLVSTSVQNLAAYAASEKLDGGYIAGMIQGLSEVLARRTCQECRARFLGLFTEQLKKSTYESAERQGAESLIESALASLLGRDDKDEEKKPEAVEACASGHLH